MLPLFFRCLDEYLSLCKSTRKVFELIQKKVIQEKLTIGQAINSIEQEFNPNSYSE
jgi:hypothetical protein